MRSEQHATSKKILTYELKKKIWVEKRACNTYVELYKHVSALRISSINHLETSHKLWGRESNIVSLFLNNLTPEIIFCGLVVGIGML